MSSKIKKSLSSMKKITTVDVKTTMALTIIISIIYNLCVLMYVLNLEKEECKCFRDWRHEFMKYYSFALIIWGMLSFAFNLSESKNEIINTVSKISMVAYLINIWCVYSYVGILDYTQCKCAIVETKKTHYFLYIFRYVLVALIFMSLFGIIIKALK
jgi:hypothetical protein